MTNYAASDGDFGVHEKTLVASTVDKVTFQGRWAYVEVVNEDGADEIYFTADGTVPTAKGGTTYVIPATTASRSVRVRKHVDNTTVVQIVSEGTPKYGVQVDVDR